ncbi:MAG: hypothetical protein ACRC62_18195 [Microcoleus sp.]
MFPSIEEIKVIMATTGLSYESALGHWQDQQAFRQIQADMSYQQQLTYENLSPQGQSFVNNLRRQCQAAQAAAWQ